MIHACPCLGGFAQRDVLSKVGCVKQPTKQARLFLVPLILCSAVLESHGPGYLSVSWPPFSNLSLLPRPCSPLARVVLLRGISATPATFDRRPHARFPHYPTLPPHGNTH
jgi:hypothetical protein